MVSRTLVFCDPEEEFTSQLSTYLKSAEEFPWILQSYTNIQEFKEYLKVNADVDCLVAESILEDLEEVLEKGKIILLNESGVLAREEYCNVYKYQPADQILKQLLQVYVERNVRVFPSIKGVTHTKMIGMFSPVGRSMQSSFALCYGQLLSQKHKTLYLNFEYYCGQKELLGEEKGKDLMTLLYYLKSEKEKFMARLQSMCKRIGEMDYIEPAFMGPNLVYVTGEDWLELIQEIEKTGLYEYVILDLCEGLQGFFDILRKCEVIYTMVRPDYAAVQKQQRYEEILYLNDYKDIYEKTRLCNLPTLYHLPEKVEEWQKSELHQFVRSRIEQDLEGRKEGGIND